MSCDGEPLMHIIPLRGLKLVNCDDKKMMR